VLRLLSLSILFRLEVAVRGGGSSLAMIVSLMSVAARCGPSSPLSSGSSSPLLPFSSLSVA
jgi:hypothetical protein